ncbi:MAG: ATP-grasp domain-containing protein [Leptospirales bacterium]|nr:ATP-grasp domain-containing protein [Leptospirales bacterium]
MNQIVLPADFFEKNRPDEAFQSQATAFARSGFSVHTLDFEGLTSKSRFLPKLSPSATLFRGWMLSLDKYQTLLAAIESAGATPFTSSEQYRAAHHLPQWYPLLRELTPETVILVDLEQAETTLRNLSWDRFFIKDFVKSLKTSVGSIIDSPDKITELISEMKKFRGTVEGGLCIRKVEDIIPESEQRFFVWKQVGYASDATAQVPEEVKFAASVIPSQFFSVDLVRTKTGKNRIVEIGDGQVSDIVGWTPERLSEILST